MYVQTIQWEIVISCCSPTVLYCGHGPHIEEGVEAIQNYISHREKRIQQVFKVLLGADEESVKPMSAAEVYALS